MCFYFSCVRSTFDVAVLVYFLLLIIFNKYSREYKLSLLLLVHYLILLNIKVLAHALHATTKIEFHSDGFVTFSFFCLRQVNLLECDIVRFEKTNTSVVAELPLSTVRVCANVNRSSVHLRSVRFRCLSANTLDRHARAKKHLK